MSCLVISFPCNLFLAEADVNVKTKLDSIMARNRAPTVIVPENEVMGKHH